MNQDGQYNGQKKKDKRTNNDLQNTMALGSSKLQGINMIAKIDHGYLCLKTLKTNSVISNRKLEDNRRKVSCTMKI